MAVSHIDSTTGLRHLCGNSNQSVTKCGCPETKLVVVNSIVWLLCRIMPDAG